MNSHLPPNPSSSSYSPSLSPFPPLPSPRSLLCSLQPLTPSIPRSLSPPPFTPPSTALPSFTNFFASSSVPASSSSPSPPDLPFFFLSSPPPQPNLQTLVLSSAPSFSPPPSFPSPPSPLPPPPVFLSFAISFASFYAPVSIPTLSSIPSLLRPLLSLLLQPLLYIADFHFRAVVAPCR